MVQCGPLWVGLYQQTTCIPVCGRLGFKPAARFHLVQAMGTEEVPNDLVVGRGATMGNRNSTYYLRGGGTSDSVFGIGETCVLAPSKLLGGQPSAFSTPTLGGKRRFQWLFENRMGQKFNEGGPKVIKRKHI